MGLPGDSSIGVKFNGRKATYSHPGSFSLRFDGHGAHDIPGTLQPLIMPSMGAAFTSGIPEPPHSLCALDIPRNKESLQAGFQAGGSAGFRGSLAAGRPSRLWFADRVSTAGPGRCRAPVRPAIEGPPDTGRTGAPGSCPAGIPAQSGRGLGCPFSAPRWGRPGGCGSSR